MIVFWHFLIVCNALSVNWLTSNVIIMASNKLIICVHEMYILLTQGLEARPSQQHSTLTPKTQLRIKLTQATQ